MVGIVGVTGLAGAGKTTAVRYLSSLTNGRILYLGQAVLDELRARGLSDTRDNERKIRIDLRDKNGPAALALPFADTAAECLANQVPVFVDAIYTQEEFGVLRSCFPQGSAHLLAIEASFPVRQMRLARKPERTFNADELRERDNTELKVLRTSIVIAAAEYSIRNEETVDEFYRELATFLDCCA